MINNYKIAFYFLYNVSSIYSYYLKTNIDLDEGLEKQQYFNSILTREEQESLLSFLNNSVSKKKDIFCDPEALFFQELLIAYFQDKNTILLEGKLVAQLDDGTSVPIELEGQGTFT